MAQTNESQEQVTINVETLQPVTRTLMTIGALPTSYLISMTYEEQLLWLQNYLIQTVIPAINNNAEATQEVQDIVMALQDYINDYFNNLDVQEEINNKLDQMAQDGSLTTLIENYVNPYIQAQNQEISNFKASVNNQIAQQNAQIQAVESGSPLVATSVSEMTDTTRVYVNTTDGNWYYYNGTAWVSGGVYQAAENSEQVVNNTKDIENLYNHDEFFRNNVVTKFIENSDGLMPVVLNREDLELYSTNHLINANGTINERNGIDIYRYIIDETKDVYIGAHMSNGIQIKGSQLVENIETHEESYENINEYVNHPKYPISTNTLKFKEIYINYDKDHDLGIDKLIIYRKIGNVIPNKIVINPYEEIISRRCFIRDNTINNITPSINTLGFVYHSYNVCKVKINNKYNYYKVENVDLTQYEGCCYDENDNYLGNITTEVISIREETESKPYMRIVKLKFLPNTSYIKLNMDCNNNLYIEEIEVEKKKLFSTCTNKPYIFNGKKITFFGDSITWLGGNDTSYAKYFSDLNGNTFDNFGVSGYCMAERPGATNTIPSVIKSKDLSNSDYIFVAGGVNDYGHNVPLGISTDTQKTTFYGAMNDLASYLKQNYPTKEVIFILPIINTRTKTWNNTPLEHDLNEYRTIIYNVAITNGFSVVNGLDFAFPEKDSAIYTDLIYDDTHPSELGRKVYAKSLSDILN